MTERMHAAAVTVKHRPIHRVDPPATRRAVGHHRSGAAFYRETQLRGVPPAAVVASTAIGNPFVAARLVGPAGHVYHALSFAANRAGALRRAQQVLKPGGALDHQPCAVAYQTLAGQPKFDW